MTDTLDSAQLSAPATANPHQQMLQLLGGKMVAAAVCTLARIDVADLLADGPRPVAELASATGMDADMLYRFLRAAGSAGVFTETADGVYGLTPMGELLRTDVPGSLRDLAAMYGETSIWNCFGDAIDTLRTGEPTGPKYRGGQGWFPYMEQHPEWAQTFHRAMTGVSEKAIRAAEVFDFGRFGKVADIGGGQGRLLSAILGAHPEVQGLLFDQASAVQGAAPVLEAAGVADRAECVVGDFFQSIPGGCDAYVLKAILHDWNDEDSIRILRNIRAAMAENDNKAAARVLIVEAVVPAGDGWHFSKAMDIAMGVSLGGKERSEQQWRELLAEAGFELVAVTETAPPHAIVEARPVF
ncbi:methyltransferase [Streptoverticillium reticulum]|uniref:methyltransferase n=1 Tax=Streptomyces TaxID=1883 RepID=UPI00369892D7